MLREVTAPAPSTLPVPQTTPGRTMAWAQIQVYGSVLIGRLMYSKPKEL